MSVDKLAFFLSTEQVCSYLPDIPSSSVFVDPNGPMNTETYSILIEHGFRRSANLVYRPHCPSCGKCKSTRLPVHLFKPNRNQKRIRKRNFDLRMIELPAKFNTEHFELYKKYIHKRHEDGAMDHDDPERYFEFLDSQWCNTQFIEFRLDDKLLALAVTDVLTHGLSALYTFFDPDEAKRSLGTYAILWQIQRAQELKKSWLYLGYWIEDCAKMRYKTQFKPIEIWHDEKWQLLQNYLP